MEETSKKLLRVYDIISHFHSRHFHTSVYKLRLSILYRDRYLSYRYVDEPNHLLKCTASNTKVYWSVPAISGYIFQFLLQRYFLLLALHSHSLLLFDSSLSLTIHLVLSTLTFQSAQLTPLTLHLH